MKSIYYYLSCTCLLMFLQMQSQHLCAQTNKFTLTGSVSDTLGRQIEGVSVSIKGTGGRQTRTDQNGNFVLEVNVGSTLTFSFVGYTSVTVEVKDRNPVNVMLVASAREVDEVVVTAFSQKQRKEAVVGSVTSVEPGKLKIPASNLTNALAGQIAGVIGFQRSGQPGQDNSQFFIR